MINVLDPEFYVDPWQAYRWLRDEAGLSPYSRLGHQAHPGRDNPRPGRRRGDHADGHRVDDSRAGPSAGPAADPDRAPWAARHDRGRGVHPLGVPDPEHAPHGGVRP